MPTARAAGHAIAYEWIGEETGKPPLVFLHEGLGSIRQWRDFPAKVAAATGCRALVYDRYGYGDSDVLQEKRRTVRFMHDEALIALPELLKKLRIENPVLIGHSDGASIALIHAGGGHPVRGVVAMAPHVFIEPLCLRRSTRRRRRSRPPIFGRKLARYHRDARKTFYGWADVWLDPEFKGWDIRGKYLPGMRCPVLGIQGVRRRVRDDGAARQISSGWPPYELLKLEQCGHAPFKDQPEKTPPPSELRGDAVKTTLPSSGSSPSRTG